MTNTSVTLQQETGIADAIDGGGPPDSARNKMTELDYATQLQEMKAIAGTCSPPASTRISHIPTSGRLRKRPTRHRRSEPTLDC